MSDSFEKIRHKHINLSIPSGSFKERSESAGSRRDPGKERVSLRKTGVLSCLPGQAFHGEKLFVRYKKCKEIYCKEVREGKPLEALIVETRKNLQSAI